MVLLLSCNPSQTDHKTKSYSEFYENKNVKKECQFKSSINQNHYLHHCKLYHENGNLAQEGDFLDDTIETGWHYYFRKNGSIKAQREFLQIAPQQFYLNRVYRFEINGDTDRTNSNFYKITFDRDTVSAGDMINVIFKLEAPYFKSSYMNVILTDSAGTDYRLPTNHLLYTTFSFNASGKGKQELKGYLDEIEVEEKQADTLKVRKRPLYFKEPYFVK